MTDLGKRFERLTDKNITQLMPFYTRYGLGICDHTVGAVFQWRDIYETYYSITGGWLCVRAGYGEFGDCYFAPIGEGDPEFVLGFIEQDAKERNAPLRYCAPKESLPMLIERYGERMSAESVRDWADYVYDAEAFRSYAGKQLHTQRNHVNRFYRDYPDASLKVIKTPEEEREALMFLERYESEHPEASELERNEVNGARELLRERVMLGQTAALLTANGQIAALTIGEARGDTLFVHVEKASKDFSGAYQAVAQAFVRLFPYVRTVNREDDGGDPGLRYSKTQYRPRELVEKYYVVISDS